MHGTHQYGVCISNLLLATNQASTMDHAAFSGSVNDRPEGPYTAMHPDIARSLGKAIHTYVHTGQVDFLDLLSVHYLIHYILLL